MDNRVRQFLADAKQTKLSASEKVSICTELEEHMSSYALKVSSQDVKLTKKEHKNSKAALKSFIKKYPASERYARRTFSFHSLHFWTVRIPALAMMAVLLISAGGSVTYAAGSSLPGDTLYPVKVDLIEPLWEKMHFSHEGRTRFIHKRIERRLQESEDLIRDGRFTPEHREHLEQRIEKHSQRMRQKLESMSSTNTATEWSVHLEESLEQHESILSGIQDGSLTDEEVHVFIEDIRSKRKGMNEWRQKRRMPPEMHPGKLQKQEQGKRKPLIRLQGERRNFPEHMPSRRYNSERRDGQPSSRFLPQAQDDM